MKSPLTPQQQRFCDEYLLDCNGQHAAVRAGYSPKYAGTHAWQLLKKPAIKQYIADKQAAYAEALNIKAHTVLQQYAAIAFFDIRRLYDENQNLIPLHELPDEVAMAIESFQVKETYDGDIRTAATVKVKLHSKLDALNDLAKHLGLFEKDNKQQKDDSHTVVYIGNTQISRV